MQPLVQGVYNSVLFALILLIAHFMIKNDVGQRQSGGSSRENMAEETPLPPSSLGPLPASATVTLEMQGGDVDADSDAEQRRRRRADEQKSMLFAYVQGGGKTAPPESVLNGGSLGLGDISSYDAVSGYGSFSRAS